jgi:hypothetical protein
MPTVNLSPLGGAASQFLDNNGVILSGGKLYSYAAGTTTPQITYTSAAGVTPHANPIILDSAGRVPGGEIWLTDALIYKFTLETSTGVLLGTYDNISGINDINLNAAFVDYDPPFAGALNSGYTVQDKLSQTVSVKDFGAVGNGVANDTVAIQAALDSGAGGVYFPSGNYLVSSVEASSNTTIYGDGNASQLTASGTGNILVVTGVSGGTQIENVLVQNLSFLGLNNMSAGPLGCGVIVLHAVNVTVDQCYFDSFGPGVADTATGGAALLFYVNCVDVTASNNTVVNGTGYLNGTDIALYSAAGYGIVTGNRTYSTNSQGIYTNAATKTGRIIITNNISRNHTRHGIIPVYAGTNEKIDTIVANNICEDCASTGIYVNTEADGVVIANNIIESCSGGGPNGYTLDGGISLLGIGKRICIGNYINNTGYTSAGVQRVIDPPTVNTPTNTAGIRVSNGVAGIVSSNVIVGGSGRGIDLANGANGVQIVDNTITNPEYAAIHIESLNNVGANSVIARNKIDVSVSDAMGIWHRGSIAADQCFIDENRIKGKKAATSKDGIRFEGNGITGSVSRNNIGDFDVGFNIQSVAMSTRLGDACVSDGNQLHDSTEGFRFLSDLTDFGFYTNFVFDSNGTDVVDAYARNTVRPAVSVSPVYLFYRSTFPAVGTWSVGDRVINTVPTVGQPKSWVCTVAGTPGTWVSEGNL